MAGAGILPLKNNVLTMISTPVSTLAAFGPAVGAFYSLRTLKGKGAIQEYLRGLLDLKLGWKAWLIPVFVLGGSTWLAWVLPELWGAPRLAMLLPSVWVFPVYVLVMAFFGGGQEELGWRGYILDPLEEKLGPWIGNLVLGVDLGSLASAIVFHSGNQPDVYALCRIYAADHWLFVVFCMGAPGLRETHAGGIDGPWMGQCVYSFVPHSGDG